MPANLAIDDRLLQEACKLGGHLSHWETVNDALREYVERREQTRIQDIEASSTP